MVDPENTERLIENVGSWVLHGGWPGLVEVELWNPIDLLFRLPLRLEPLRARLLDLIDRRVEAFAVVRDHLDARACGAF